MGLAIMAVDCQFDFTVAGALPIPGADGKWISQLVIGLLNYKLEDNRSTFIATKDWHPENHASFKGWPKHCIANTGGAELVVTPDIFDLIIEKGSHPNYESYSAFEDETGFPTPLDDYLRVKEISHLIVFGLATDYCVKATVLDALDRGYTVEVLLDLCRCVDSATGDQAVAEMNKLGAKCVTSKSRS